MACPDPLFVQAYVDGELGADAAVRMEAHLASCATCESQRQAIFSVARAIGTRASYRRLPAGRREAVLEAFRRTTAPAGGAAAAATGVRHGRAWYYWTGTASGAAAAALVVFALGGVLGQGREATLVNDLVGAHIRSLLSDRLIDVESSDRHTVKPWFAGHADVSPPVADFPEQNYHLVGGRVDYVDGRRAAVVVYRHGAHVINVFAWPDSGARLPAGLASRNGYNLSCWKTASVDFCATSDAVGEELAGLTRLLQPLTGAPRE